MLEAGADRSALGASLLGARRISSRRWLEFSETNLAARVRADGTISGSDFAQEACFDLHERDLCWLEK